MTHRLKTSADGGRNRGGDCFGDLLLRKLRLNGGQLRVHWLAFKSVDPLLRSRSSEHCVRVARAYERGRGVTVEEVLPRLPSGVAAQSSYGDSGLVNSGIWHLCSVIS